MRRSTVCFFNLWFYPLYECMFAIKTPPDKELDSSEMTHCRWVYACLDLDITIVLWCWWVTDPDFNLAGNAVGGESNLSLHLQGRTFLYIYHLELISALALLSVSQGLSACSPSVLKQLLHSPNSRTMAQQQQIRYGPVHHVRWDNRNEACSNCFFYTINTEFATCFLLLCRCAALYYSYMWVVCFTLSTSYFL